MKVRRMGITEILRRIWVFSANKIKSSESFSKQPIQLIIDLNSSLQHIIVTNAFSRKKIEKWKYFLFLGCVVTSGLHNLLDCVVWAGDKPDSTDVVVMSLETGKVVSQMKTKGIYSTHHINAYEDLDHWPE